MNITTALKAVRKHVRGTPSAERHKDPFKILVSVILSARTKDKVTARATKRLFTQVKRPNDLTKLSQKQIQELIYPVGFYKTKAKHLKQLPRFIKNGIPQEISELVMLPGVGRKTANLVRSSAFNKPGICVDTHVHRITNRWDYVKTRTPHKTEMVLRKKLPKNHWKEINHLLVLFGQNTCTPISPWCSKCPVRSCKRVGVTRTR
jgi:endonuclease III